MIEWAIRIIGGVLIAWYWHRAGVEDGRKRAARAILYSYECVRHSFASNADEVTIYRCAEIAEGKR